MRAVLMAARAAAAGTMAALLPGALLTAVLATGPVVAASPPETVRLQPIDGGHWQGGAGLADSRGSAGQALVRTVDGSDHHPEVAAITGLEGGDTGEVERLGFTVAVDEAGIIPCIRVAFTDALGNARELMITSRTMRARPVPEAGWTAYSFDAGLPPGGTIDAIEVGVHAEAHPPEPIRVVFDDLVVNDTVFTRAGDAGTA